MSAYTPYYRPAGAAMLRASVYPARLDLPPWPADSAEPGTWRTWLTAAWALPRVAEATAQASPHLATQIDAMHAGRQPDARSLRRMALTLARYLLRMRSRATPFGAFAGVTAASFCQHTQLRWSDDHTLHTRADPSWLADITARLEACTPLLERLPVVVNDLARVRGGRLIVPWQPHQSAVPGNQVDKREVSVRLVPVVETIRHAAHKPILVGALIDQAAAAHPGATRQALRGVAGQLAASGVLISALRAPSTTTDVLAHLRHQLDAAGAHDLPEAEPLIAALNEGGADRPTADLRLGGSLVLPHAVAAEAAAAAEALIRLSPATTATASWRDYHRAFLSRYGPGTLVPVEELTDPGRGLGLPNHFTQPPSSTREMTQRDEMLLALAQQAALDGDKEVVLDDTALAALAGPDGQRPVTPADLWVDIRATSPAALDDGAFTLGVCGFGRTGANTGRFLNLLNPADREAMTRMYAAQPPSVDGAIRAQLSFPSCHSRTESILRVPAVLPYVVPLAEHRTADGSHIPVADLAVAAGAARLYVVSRSRQRVVEPVLLHAGARYTMPPLARLLFEIPRSVHPAVTTLDWGAASCLSFLPRVRYGRSILAPAQWRVDPATLPGPDATEREWSAALDEVRERRSILGRLAAGSGDRRLRLDLDEPMGRAVLRSHLESADGPVILTETPAVDDYGWCGGRAHEVVIPLAATTPADPAPAFLTGAAPPVTRSDRSVVYVKLHGQPEAFDTILTAHMGALLRRWPTPPRWWFARYLHPAPHLRLRIHDADWRASGHVADWAADLRHAGLAGQVTFDNYHPETGRYGTGQAMAAAEALFAADSAAVLAQLACLASARDIHPQALTASSLVDLAAAVMGSRSAGVRWLLDHPEYAEGAGAQNRELRRQTLRLVAPDVLHGLPGGPAVVTAWEARADAAAHYTALLTPDTASPRPETVLGSLLHLHHARARGIDPQSEAATYKLARAAALSHAARQKEDMSDRA
ncbi:lantibiotic dehydratase [Streptomyces sp. DSM 42041]|uniref:Lantibiotic dehydratase n=1 Tax=Streptomyces hazeniae TaxID=3075538 RepID=A0ABU2NJP1_9ACTN|nr:lantibiotic dehydratase [Streptomyces sp. DSM 42041]MDT0377202.1 lantibiotic dehydratase [Streptomyces sp. DSM 42041]